ncbi:MAG TPA: hypothetical protein VLU25_01715 [Acidobacteriota bacterium]|nr:hypothetical protein [Acidobacteriota bacterium]
MVDYYQQHLENRPADGASGSDHLKQFFYRACWIGLGVLVILAYVWIQSEGLTTSFRTAQLERHNQDLEAEVQALKVQYWSLTDPEQIDQQARDMGFIRYDQGIPVLQGEVPLFEPGTVMMASN